MSVGPRGIRSAPSVGDRFPELDDPGAETGEQDANDDAGCQEEARIRKGAEVAADDVFGDGPHVLIVTALPIGAYWGCPGRHPENPRGRVRGHG